MTSHDKSITEILRDHGYGHRPADDNGFHAIFSFNTMEVIAVARAGYALEAVGIDA